MATRLTPAALLAFQASALRTQLGCVFDGDADGVHDARVATRRIRELLRLRPATGNDDDHNQNIVDGFAAIGRALGRVRDIDARLALVTALETRMAHVAPSLVFVRQHFEARRLVKVRRLIKTLERLDVDALLGVLESTDRDSIRARLAANGWPAQLRGLVLERASEALDQMAHATGVYFPNRVHRARVALKRLRYTAEILEATGMSRVQPAIKRLTKVQGILGDVHDRQELADWLSRQHGRDGLDPGHVEVTCQMLTAEVLEMHRQYLQRRSAVRAASAEIQQAAWAGPSHVRAVAIATAVAVTGVVWTRLALTNAEVAPAR